LVDLKRSGAILDAGTVDTWTGGRSFTRRNLAWRLAWRAAWLVLAAWTPPPARAWRRRVLRAFGAELAEGANVYGSARIWNPRNLRMGPHATLGPRVNCYNMDAISLGARALVSQGAHLCAGSHDIDSPVFQLVTRPITIEAEAWIAAEAFVGPGVRVGEGAVLGARAVAFRNLDAWTVYSGNPAVPLRQRRRRGAA
jgi:putative colanic acid biosynthesis acetyltransferase WcaF